MGRRGIGMKHITRYQASPFRVKLWRRMPRCDPRDGFVRSTRAPSRTTTGPSRPESGSESFLCQCFHVVKVRRSFTGRAARGFSASGLNHAGQALIVIPFQAQSSGNCSSPMSRLTQVLVTFTVSVFSPALRWREMSCAKGGCHQTPRSCPLTETSARSRTTPRSRMAAWSGLSAGRVKVVPYWAVPEK